MKKIFVYGTLKSGEGNWRGILKDKEDVKFIGEDVIKGNFTMVSLGGFPGVIPHDEGNTNIHGQVFEVGENAFRNVEMLEGYPNFYNRMPVSTKYGRAEMYILGKDYLNYNKIENGIW